MANYDYEYYKTGAGKTALSLPTWAALSDLSSGERDSIQTDLESNDLSWPPEFTPGGDL